MVRRPNTKEITKKKIKTQNGDTRSPRRGHCILFRAVVSALPAAFPFGCCVATLPQSGNDYAPGLLSLRRGTLAHRRLAKRQLISTVCKTCVGLRMLPLRCIPYSGMTVQKPTAVRLVKHEPERTKDLRTSQNTANQKETKERRRKGTVARETLQLPNCSSARRPSVHPCIISVIALYAIVAV